MKEKLNEDREKEDRKKKKKEKNLSNAINAIVNMDVLSRESERRKIANEYKVRVSVIDQYIHEATKKEKKKGNEVVKEVEPYGEPVDGIMLLDSIEKTLSKHVILPQGVADAISVWSVLTYCTDAFRILPNLGITSPVKRCGKTTLLEVLQGLTNKALTASNISPAAVFRTIDRYHPTLLIDEADTFLKDNDELRGVLNSGHTRSSAFVIRVEGDDHEPVKFSTWGPKAISMIGNLPETLQDRSVVVELRRKFQGESAVKINIDFEAACADLRKKCRRWSNDNKHKLTITRPQMPKIPNDRMVDNWMPLFTIASIAGGGWPDKIKNSLLKMMGSEDTNIGEMLLEDIREIFNFERQLSSEDIVRKLKDKTDRPWIDWNRGKGLTQNGLARLLRPFGIKSKNLRINENIRKGYDAESLTDAFNRYIPPAYPFQSATPLQTNNINELRPNQTATNKKGVAVEKQDNHLKLHDCSGVADEKGVLGGMLGIDEKKQPSTTVEI